MKKFYLLILLFLPLLIISAENNSNQEKHKKEIDLLKKNHSAEIILYQEKISTLMTKIEEQKSMLSEQNKLLAKTIDDKK